jgi:hypothetical protein
MSHFIGSQRGWCKTGMKRFLIFSALFPPIALIIFLIPEANVSGLPHAGFVFLTLALVYPIGLVPAAITAAVDWSLSKSAFYLRIAATVIVSMILAELMARLYGGSGSLTVWLMGAIPAAVCSWLSSNAGPSVS